MVNNNNKFKKVLISGSSGLIGQKLCESLKNDIYNSTTNTDSTSSSIEYEIYKLVRRTPKSIYEIEWNPEKSYIDNKSLELLQPNIVIHLAGESFLGILSNEKIKKIEESRINGTRLICESLSKLINPPELFISASGSAFYDSYENDSTLIDESFPKGNGLFSEIIDKWEKSNESLIKYNNSHQTSSKKQIRIVNLRIGYILNKNGGILSLLYYPFLFGLGSVLGSGNQYFSWVSLNDTINVIQFIIENDTINGPINVTSPNAVTNYQFTKTFGNVLNRPTFLWLPEFIINLIFGKEISNETLLSSRKIIPKKLLDYGFNFKDINLKGLLLKEFYN